MIGVDRLDYSKGLKQRMEAFATFLELSQQAVRSRVTMLQVTPKSRSEVPEYARMQRELEEEAGRINGKHGDVDWTPLRYINKSLSHSTLAGLYRMSRIGLVTPLRDGMNLVAKEYVAAQSPDNPGVLVLSQFAGAAQELKTALIVNPYDIEATAAAIARAFAMPLDEKQGPLEHHDRRASREQRLRPGVAFPAGARPRSRRNGVRRTAASSRPSERIRQNIDGIECSIEMIVPD